MTVITTFKEKKREKQIKYERSVLKDLSIKTLKERVQHYFGSSRITSSFVMHAGVEEACYDVALEAYLLGAKFSKFGYYGEDIDEVKKRCYKEEKHLIDTLFNFLLYWGNGEEGTMSESLYYLCEQYIHVWWLDGYQKGERRHKLRLH
ncbi:YbaK family protein [Neobacillus cucumis]|uniref:YbaK family protein n=1 Tax=Neobacillus cucumis TaxID=1740721 RepID=UPI0018E0242F|nr:YbaK family protein [Neobacillus cucumis]MBI0580974.1 YbaK family protein [Neobacillus cucumis]WHY92131.1 YbaK family protein [Neobacillus cucumis]